VLQSTAWYPPASFGGTEIYLAGLIKELDNAGISSRVVAPLAPDHQDGYAFEGTKVRTYSVNETPSRAELSGAAPHAGFDRFVEILAEEKPDIYHQHSLSRGLGASHLRAAHESGLRTVFTAHLPNVTCVRGTMMRYGREECDGRIDAHVCAACWSEARGAPKALALALGHVPAAVGEVLERVPGADRLATALSATARARDKRQELDTLVAHADRIVAVCQWVHDALLRNGAPRERLVLSRQGVDNDFADAAARALAEPPQGNAPRPFRIVYVGRWSPVKGIDTLVRAVRTLPQAFPIELTLYGLPTAPEEQAYQSQVRDLTGDDARINFADQIPHAQLAETLARADAIAVPSVWLETGPLVVLEAKAVGLPVIGSRLGGIAELVKEPEEGVLVPPRDVAAWADAIQGLARRRLSDRRKLPSQTRSMQDVAKDMTTLYRELCAG
jgi:glycosyltransferase involved in cell wall biosynthesis